jgi:hypothetical protein
MLGRRISSNLPTLEHLSFVSTPIFKYVTTPLAVTTKHIDYNAASSFLYSTPARTRPTPFRILSKDAHTHLEKEAQKDYPDEYQNAWSKFRAADEISVSGGSGASATAGMIDFCVLVVVGIPH